MNLKENYKLCVAGSRSFDDYELMKKLLSIFVLKDPVGITLISGTAKGADTLGEKCAKEFGWEIKRCPADWDKYGKKAGIIRNEAMANEAEGAMIFWDGESKGTEHMIRYCYKRGLNMLVVMYKQRKLFDQDDIKDKTFKQFMQKHYPNRS